MLKHCPGSNHQTKVTRMTATAILNLVKPCIQCGACDRSPCGQCRFCNKANAKAWALKNPDRIKARNKKSHQDKKTAANCGIYAVRNKVSGKAYIGQSRQLKAREKQHWLTLKNGNHYSTQLQVDFNLLSQSAFEFQVLEICDVNTLTEREQHWIDVSLLIGVYNIALTAGSPLGVVRSIETRTKISLAKIGKFASEETKAKMRISQAANKEEKSAAATRRMAVPGARERQRDAITGKRASDETKEKLSIAKLSMWQADGFKAKISAVQKIAQQKISNQASQRMKDKWADPFFREQMIANRVAKKKQKLLIK